MCGGDGVVYRTVRINIGLNIIQTEKYANDRLIRRTFVDSLRRRPECCWSRSPYNRALNEADLDVSIIAIGHRPDDVIDLIEARREYMKQISGKVASKETAELEDVDEQKSGPSL